MRLAVVGKGGAGKSVVAGTIARLLGRGGRPVLAVDTDLMPGLAYSLGIAPARAGSLDGAAERDERGRWRLKKGIGPVRAVQRHAVAAPDGVRLLQCGKLGAEGLDAIIGPVRACYAVIHRLGEPRTFRDWSIVGDLPAGPRQPAFDWAPYARTFLVLAEPTWKSALTARRTARIVASRGGRALLVATKSEGAADARRIGELVGEPVFASIPADDSVAAADRAGAALLDHAPSSPAARAIEDLLDDVARRGAVRGFGSHAGGDTLPTDGT